MRKILVLCFFSFFLSFCSLAQNRERGLYDFPEAYVEVDIASPTQLRNLSERFSVDKLIKNEEGWTARLWLGPHDYDDFLATHLHFSLYQPTEKYGELEMASTYGQMASWDKYPTYSVYCAMMDTFQKRFPTLCKVDTILAATPNHHSLLACHLGSNAAAVAGRPRFYYASSIHGDEQTGFVLLLRLIDHLLTNYSSDAQVRHILDCVDLWICPVENPDGMYHLSDDVMGGWSWDGSGSVRANANGVDLNRSFPWAGQVAKDAYEPEVQAIMDFASQHHFVMSATLHGGSSVFNFPWDLWTQYENPHADNDWWWFMGRKFADTCHAYSSSSYYFTEEDNGVTPGGDWYVITGSQQDYLNYYQHCRDVTIEISDDKSPDAEKLPVFWSRLQHSFLNYIEECLNGFHGSVTDSITGEPLQAQVMIANHDVDNSEVYSYLPEGKYYRPIKAGTYQVTYSAEGYIPKTMEVMTTDGGGFVVDVQLLPENWSGIEEPESDIFRVYPNPVGDVLKIELGQACAQSEGFVYDELGRCMLVFPISDEQMEVNLSSLPKGLYFVRIGTKIVKVVRDF